MKGLTTASLLSLGSPLARTVEVHDALPSTQDRARELARAGAPHGTLVVAAVQTGGRGRLRRAWGSPEGGLWMSLVLRPDLAVTDAPRLTLAAAVAVTKTLRDLGIDAGIKWPNDVLVEPEEKKVCGILAESSLRNPSNGQTSGIAYVLLGVGLNANVDVADLDVPDRAATTLRAELGRDVEPLHLLGRLLSSLDAELRRIDEFVAILNDWRALSFTLGRQVRVERSGERLEGLAVDVSSTGALLLETANGTFEVYEGEVEGLRQGPA